MHKILTSINKFHSKYIYDLYKTQKKGDDKVSYLEKVIEDMIEQYKIPRGFEKQRIQKATAKNRPVMQVTETAVVQQPMIS